VGQLILGRLGDKKIADTTIALYLRTKLSRIIHDRNSGDETRRNIFRKKGFQIFRSNALKNTPNLAFLI
jgi:hypothetical protein